MLRHKKERHRRCDKKVTLRARLEPKFWADADGRCVTVKLIRHHNLELKNDSGVDCGPSLLCNSRYIGIPARNSKIQAFECYCTCLREKTTN